MEQSRVKHFSSFGDVEINSDKAELMVSKMNELADKGKFFSVKFTKKDNTIRTMTARTGVKKVLKGGERCLPMKYLCVYDVQTGAYRSINPETLIEVNGTEV